MIDITPKGFENVNLVYRFEKTTYALSNIIGTPIITLLLFTNILSPL